MITLVRVLPPRTEQAGVRVSDTLPLVDTADSMAYLIQCRSRRDVDAAVVWRKSINRRVPMALVGLVRPSELRGGDIDSAIRFFQPILDHAELVHGRVPADLLREMKVEAVTRMLLQDLLEEPGPPAQSQSSLFRHGVTRGF